MTKASNLSADNETNDDTMDVQLALAQHLSGLKEFGVTILPAAKGVSYEIAAPTASKPVGKTSLPASAAASTQQPKTKPVSAPAKAPAPPANRTPAAATPTASAKPETLVAQDAPYSEPIAPADRAAALTVIQQEVASCTQCPQLSDFRTNTVFWLGRSELATGVRWGRPR